MSCYVHFSDKNINSFSQTKFVMKIEELLHFIVQLFQCESSLNISPIRFNNTKYRIKLRNLQQVRKILITMKLRTYIITLAAFSMSHSLRISFSFNKNQIQQKYNVDDFFIGTLDAVFCIMFSFGAALYYFLIDRQKILSTYFKVGIGATLSGVLYALISLFFQQNILNDQQSDSFIKKLILVLSVGAFGFFNFAVWPLNLSLVSKYYKPQTDGGMVGLWASGWQLGNIVCLLFSNFMVYTLNIRWEATVLLFGFANLTCAFCVYFFLENPHQITIKQLKGPKIEQIQSPYKVTSRQFYKFCWDLLSKKQIFIFILVNGLVSSVFMSLLFWIPIYMVGINYAHISGYFTLILQVFAIIGSYFFGKIHQGSNKIDTGLISQIIKRYTSQISTLIGIVASILWLSGPQSIYLYGMLIATFGFFIGGLFNSMHSNDIFKYTKNNASGTQMFAVLLLITNYFITSIFSFAASLVINIGSKQKHDQNSKSHYRHLFYAILIVLVFILICFILKRQLQEANKEQDTDGYGKLKNVSEENCQNFVQNSKYIALKNM